MRTALLVEIAKTATVRDVSVSGWRDSVADTQWSSHARHLTVLRTRNEVSVPIVVDVRFGEGLFAK